MLNSINEESSLTKTQLMKNGSPKIGDDNAKISIVEFGDYQCTFCYKFHQNVLDDIQIPSDSLFGKKGIDSLGLSGLETDKVTKYS